MEITKPVLDFYSSKNQNFYEIDGSEKIEEISGKKLRKFLRFNTLTLKQLLI